MSDYVFGLVRPSPSVPPPTKAPKSTGTSGPKFQPLPKPSGKPPYRLNLKDIIGKVNAGKLVFHVTGDTGGIKNASPQHIVSAKMEGQFKAGSSDNPAFFYHVGDVVYFYGQEKDYSDQFFEPYTHYPAPIFAIPGNHDGDIDPTQKPAPASLDAFNKVFCAKKPVHLPISGDAPRTAMTQPNVYWTLETPQANIIGLYTNVPSGGIVKPDQKAWFLGELKNADKLRKKTGLAIIVAMHHPSYSVDDYHGHSGTMQKLLEDAISETGVTPDIILSGHVHNYQRFTKVINKIPLTYVVAGAGGYHNLHNVDINGKPIPTPKYYKDLDVTFENYCDNRFGFLRVTVENDTLTGEYFVVPRTQEPWRAPEQVFDKFVIDLKKRTVKTIPVAQVKF